MFSEEDNISVKLNQILLYLIKGETDVTIDLFEKVEQEMMANSVYREFVCNFGKFIRQYHNEALFLNAIANGNLDVNPPEDPLHENFVIAQYKQLHSDLRHLTWQTQQITKGDLKQNVSFLGEFSVAFNKMIEALREKKMMQDEIKSQNEQLQKLNAEKDKFFSIIAHDLKSPFNSIVGFSDLLVEQISKKDYAGIDSYARIIQQSSERALDLLTNLMEWARSQTGRMEFKPEYFELVTLLNEITHLFVDIARHKSITINRTLPPNAPVFADKAMISTVLRNLISNAIKFTTPGGKITISVKDKSDGLTVSVQDSGVGIPKTSINKLFRIDENYSTPGTNNEKGTGLGLILCMEFIEKHGGRIWVESEEEKGSIFYFTLLSRK